MLNLMPVIVHRRLFRQLSQRLSQQLCTAMLLCTATLSVTMPATVLAANMSLDKHRILLDEKHRRDDLLVFNPTTDFQSYRVSVADFTMDDLGQLRRNPEFAASAQPLLRVGPRLGRNIAPNNTQKFRVMLKTRNLPDGEYRSHIIVEALLPPVAEGSDGVYARPNIKYSIPVIVRKGQLDATVNITSAKFSTDKDDNSKIYLELTMARTGNRSVFGNLRAFAKSDPDKLLLEANSIGIYPEVSQRQVRLLIKNKLPHSGDLVIQFAESAEYGGDLTAEYQLPLSPS